MARDYKSRAEPRKKANNRAPTCWTWFVGGVLVGVFICGLAWLKFAADTTAPAQPEKSAQKKKAVPTQKKRSVTTSAKQTSKPRFDFYTILPEMEVVVPDPEPEPVKSRSGKIKTAGGIATTTRAADYMLQMGSFRKYADADRLKASLALVGLRAEIQKFALDGGDTFHRVRSGPYTRGQVNKLRKKLKQNKINSLVIKLKN